MWAASFITIATHVVYCVWSVGVLNYLKGSYYNMLCVKVFATGVKIFDQQKLCLTA